MLILLYIIAIIYTIGFVLAFTDKMKEDIKSSKKNNTDTVDTKN